MTASGRLAPPPYLAAIARLVAGVAWILFTALFVAVGLYEAAWYLLDGRILPAAVAVVLAGLGIWLIVWLIRFIQPLGGTVLEVLAALVREHRC